MPRKTGEATAQAVKEEDMRSGDDWSHEIDQLHAIIVNLSPSSIASLTSLVSIGPRERVIGGCVGHGRLCGSWAVVWVRGGCVGHGRLFGS